MPSLVGVALFALVLYSGFAGAQVATANFSVTFIYVVFWVGTAARERAVRRRVPRAQPVAVVRARALRWARAANRARARSLGPPCATRQRLGVWPAVAGLIGFAWLELVYVDRDVPSTLAALSLGYFVAMLVGMLLFGIEELGGARGRVRRLLQPALAHVGALPWMTATGRLSAPAVQRDHRHARCTPGTVALICTVIGTTTFDGLSNGGVLAELGRSLQSRSATSACTRRPRSSSYYSVGLLVVHRRSSPASTGSGSSGAAHVSATRYSTTRGSAASFAHTLVPIGFAYVLAHYFSLLIWQGQAIGYLVSDPLGNGANLFGTARLRRSTTTIISYAAIWYVQVAALLAGHVGGLALAHDRALAIYRNVEEAVRSQYWMLAVMVAFTSFGLWLLSAVGT